MAFSWTDDPVRDAECYAAEQDRALERCPKCTICGDPIQDEHLYLINDEFVCQACLDRDFKKSTEDYEE